MLPFTVIFPHWADQDVMDLGIQEWEKVLSILILLQVIADTTIVVVGGNDVSS